MNSSRPAALGPSEPDPAPARRLDLADELLIDAEEGAGAEAPPRPTLWVSAGLLAVAFNLRPALSSLAPLLPEVTRDLGISAALAGALTTAPVFCLGLFGPLAPRLARRLGAEAAVLACLGILAGGLALRGVPTAGALLFGTLLAGAAIGIAGVLLPGIIKRDFPAQAGLMTGLYTMLLCAGGALGAGLTVPLESLLGRGWPGALAAWSVPAIVAALLWMPQVRIRRFPSLAAAAGVRSLWRDPLAWRVTGFLGLQSSLAYIVFGWLPVALQDRGLDPLDAGLTTSGSVMAQMLTALVLPMVAARRRDQRPLVVAVLTFTVAGWVAMLFLPLAFLWPGAIALGLGNGGCFGLGLAMIVLRSPDAHVATHLSGMAQSVGYAVASLGPLGVGLARQWSGGWAAPTALFVALATIGLLCGLGAGRNQMVLAGAGP